MQPDISILLAAENRAGILPVLLAALERQTLTPGRFEVVVAGRAGGDGTLGEAERFARGSPVRITCAECAAEGAAAAFNLAAKTARARVLLFLDTLLLPCPRLVERHLSVHVEASIPTCVFGGMTNHPELLPGALTPWLLPEERPQPVDGKMPPMVWRMQNLSMPKALYSELGGLDETHLPCTAAMQLGLRSARLEVGTVFEPRAQALIWCECPLSAERQRLYYEGRALRRLADSMKIPGLEAHYRLCPPWWVRIRDRISVPHYVRAAENPLHRDPLLRFERQRVLRSDRYSGFAHEAAGTPPPWPPGIPCSALPAVPGSPLQNAD